MDGDGDPDLSRHPEPPARTPQQIEEQARRRVLEAKKPTKTGYQGPFARHQGAFARLALARRRHSQPSSSRQTRSSAASGAGTATRIRQSVLYRPRRSRGRRGRARLEEHAGEVSSSEGPTVKDLSEFKALALNDTPPKLELTDRSDESAYDTARGETYSEIIEEEEPKDESDYDLEEELREIEEYLQEHTCDSVSEMFDKLLAAQPATVDASCDKDSDVDCAIQTARDAEWVREQPRLVWWHKSLDSLLPEGQASSADAQHSMAPSRDEPSPQWSLGSQPRCEVADEDIIQNGKNWMSEEAMVAFRKYAERSANLKGLAYKFEELCQQCFNVECHYKIFHHYNFTVKMKNPSSVDWRVVMYFAEVKEIFGRKYYFCCPLESSENGQCYACNNQGMNDLKHPATGGFERGSPDTVFPYMYSSD